MNMYQKDEDIHLCQITHNVQLCEYACVRCMHAFVTIVSQRVAMTVIQPGAPGGKGSTAERSGQAQKLIAGSWMVAAVFCMLLEGCWYRLEAFGYLLLLPRGFCIAANSCHVGIVEPQWVQTSLLLKAGWRTPMHQGKAKTCTLS